MLKPTHTHRGFTIVEAMVVVTIFSVIIAWGVPAFATWMENTRIRGTAESILSGLQYARGEATSRNAQVRFQLVTGMTASCNRTSTSTAWVVDLVDAANDSVENNCHLAPNDINPVPPSILQKKANREGGGGNIRAVESNGVTQVVFNGLGRVTPVPADDIEYAVSSTSGTCRESAGDLTCLRILVSAAGQIRMCSDSFPSGDPQRCSP